MKFSQRTKVLLFTFTLLYLSIGALTVLCILKDRSTEKMQRMKDTEEVTNLVDSAVSNMVLSDSLQITSFLQSIVKENGLIWAYLVDDQAQPIAGHGFGTMQSIPQVYRDYLSESTGNKTLRSKMIADIFVTVKTVTGGEMSTATTWTGKRISTSFNPLYSNWLYIGGGLLLFSLFALFFLIRYLFSPLSRVVDGINAVINGDYDHRIQVKTKDEYRVLAISVNRIAQTMKAWRSELAQASDHTNNIIRSMVDMLLVVSPNGNIRMANAATCENLHYSQNDLSGKPVQHIIPEFPFEMFTPERLEKEGFINDLEIYYLTKDRRLIPVSFSASAMRDEHGNLIGVVCVAQDITERKRYESELIDARDEAEEMSRLKSAFLANMSHEIRTPLTGIIGYAQILVDEVPDGIREFADMIAKGARRLHDTLNSVLELARLEANERKLAYEKVDVAVEIRDTLKLFASTAEEKGITLRGPNVGTTFAYVDRIALNRIVSNLVNNALKFTTEGRVIVRMRTRDRWLELLVEDTGIGIKKKFLPHIFDEFKQESTGESRSYEGSGLGLTITQKLVHLHKGNIQVRSKEGKGTSFLVRLPRIHPDQDVSFDTLDTTVMTGDASPVDKEITVSVRKPDEIDPDKARLLVVEDNPETRKLLIHELGELYNLDAVSTGGEAINLARQGEYDVIVMDINLGMGQRTGTEIMKLLRKLPRYRNVPFVAITAYALPGDKERFLKEGFDCYVSKPFEMDILHETLANMVKTSV